MKRIIVLGGLITGLLFTACNRYSYRELPAADKNAAATVHNVNNIFN